MTSRFHVSYLVLLLLILSVAFGCGSSAEQEQKLRISAAASMTDALQELTAEFEARTSFKTRTDFASSSVLARQIEQGRETDLFFSANRHWIKYLLERDLLSAKKVTKIVTNSLAVIAPENSGLEISSLKELVNTKGRIALGDPSHVPAGMYGKQALRNAGHWTEVKDRIVGAVDTRAALAYVQQETVPLGIVYLTDARAGDGLEILFEVDERHTPEINYYLAWFQHQSVPTQARRRFIDFSNSKTAKQIFEKYGFIPVK